MTDTAELKNCPLEAAKGLIRFRCPKRWDELDETDDEAVRLCDKCNESVHFVTTHDELGRAYRDGRCVAIGISSKSQTDDGFDLVIGPFIATIGELTLDEVTGDWAVGAKSPKQRAGAQDDDPS